MVKRLLSILLLALVAVVVLVLFNTFRFSNTQPSKEALPVAGISDSAAIHLSNAIQIKTISFGDTLAIDTSEFLKFRSFMESAYPIMHQKLARQSFNEFSYVFTWKGKDTTRKPIVLMGHLDVVPVEAVAESKWTVPSFSGLIKNDTVWGRGAVDDKGSCIAIMEAVEQLLKEGFVPPQTIYLCFGHDEEISGKRGAAVMSKWFRDNKIEPALVLDEGGMIDTEILKEAKRPLAVIGVGEKGFVNIDMAVEIAGGHSSMPHKETSIDVLNKAIENVRKEQMPATITPAVDEMLKKMGPYQGFTTRMAISNLWLFKGLLISEMEKSNQTNAMIHTTLVPTIVRSGIKDNVIPSIANATFNSRILPGETSDDVVNFVKKAVNDERVSIKKQSISLMEPSTTTSTEHPMYKMIETVTYKTVPGIVVSPYLVVGATDSRYFRGFSDAVFNFTAIQNAKGFHGIDERIGISDLKRMIFFYTLLIKGN